MSVENYLNDKESILFLLEIDPKGEIKHRKERGMENAVFPKKCIKSNL